MNSTPSWPQVLSNLLAKRDLTKAESSWAMQEIMSGNATGSQVGGFLLALRSKGETPDEISGFVDVMLENAVKVPVSNDAIDIVGTGGDQLGTVNISTMAAIVAAAAGYPVLKHGSRSASGKTGSSEVLEALGVKLTLSPEDLASVFNTVGLSFFFAPLFHPALKHVVPIRKELGVPTTFNFLGPLANPVQPVATALGVANPAVLPLAAAEMVSRGRSALVFRGNDGLDEMTITGNNKVILVHAGQSQEFDFDPQTLGISRAKIEDLVGGDAEQNARVARELFGGNLGENDPILTIVALNAAAGMTAYDLSKTSNLESFEFQEAIAKNFVLAKETILNGKALAKLNEWIATTQSYGE